MGLLKHILDLLRTCTAEQWTAIFTAVIAFTGIFALWFAARQLSHGKELAKVQHIMGLVEKFDREPIIQYRRQLAIDRLRGVTDSEELNEVLNFFELVGVLLRRNYLDEEDVWENFGYWVFPLYVDAKSLIKEMQREDRNAYTNLEELYCRIREVEHKHNGNTDNPTPAEIAAFWKSEKNTVTGGAPKRRPKSQRKIDLTRL